MAIIDQLPALDVIDKLRGKLDFYVLCRGGEAKTVCVRKWPEIKKVNMSPASVAAQIPFAAAARAVAAVTPQMQAVYSEMAAGTSYTWKDVAMALILKPSNIYKTV